jgi:hypothetical protein
LFTLQERDHPEDLGLDERITLNFVFKENEGDVYWVNLAPDRVKWRALLNTVMKFWVPQNWGEFLE